MPTQSRILLTGILVLTCLTGRSLDQPTNAATEWEVKQVASDEVIAKDSGDYYDRDGNFVAPGISWVDSEVYVRSGSKLKFKKDLHHARLPKWSPDGQYLAFLTICHGVRIQCLETATRNTWHRVRLTDSPKKLVKDWTSTTVNFAWSPSGDEIAYLEETRNGPSTIFLVKADGSGRREIQHLRCHYSDDLDYRDATLEWSPDAKKLAFHDCSDAIVVFDRESAENHTVARGWHPLWSPDGKMLLFRKGLRLPRGSNERREVIVDDALWVVNVDEKQESECKVLEHDLMEFGVSWLPSGKRIAFGSTRGNSKFAEIFRINVDGTGLEKVASAAGKGLSLASPIFSPDERQLLVVGEAGLPCLSRAEDLAVCRSADGLPARPSPSVLLIDLASGRQEKVSIGDNPSVVWDRK